MASVGELFDRAADDYDHLRRRIVPCLDAFYDAALDAATWAQPDREVPLRVLDLGAGTGLLSERFAGAYPRAAFRLVDVADEMLARARERFAGQSERFSFQTTDFAHSFPDGTFHIIISGLSIHHLPDEAKQGLYRRCFRALVPGGVLVNADEVAGPDRDLTQHYLKRWQRQVREAGATEEQLAEAEDRMQADKPTPLADQLRWLEALGFASVDCPFKDGMFAVLSGRRPVR